MNRNEIIKEKILAYFNGRLSPVDEAWLVSWIKENEENKAYFFAVKNQLNPDEMNHPLLKSSFSELKNKLFIEKQFESVSKGRVRKISLSFSKIAALVILAVLLGFTASLVFNSRTGTKSEVAWFETNVLRGEKSQIILPDGSKVWLNSETSLSYPSNFMNGNRELKLNGEAYFEVAKQNGRHFTVKTKDYDIRVVGTKFNVTAYNDFKRTETSLIEGKIEIRKEDKKFEVTPGQTFIYKNNRFFVKETNTTKSAKWKDDIFDFDRITFRELITRLERWYDVDIELKGEKLNDIVYSGVFKNEETIEEVLNTFQLTMPIKYKKEDFRKFSIQPTNKTMPMK